MNINNNNWNKIQSSLNEKGYAILNDALNKAECKSVLKLYNKSLLFRKTVIMERHRYGLGEYKYFHHPLPKTVQKLREDLYKNIYAVANDWMKMLNMAVKYPPALEEFLEICKANHQTLATPLMLKYGAGGYNALHQDLYGSVYFPMQAVVFLNEPGADFTGGEFVLTEQIPRAQSKAIVLNPAQGDVLIFTTQFRPQKGTKGYYRVNMKHGVSNVHSGSRHTLGIIFHDAK